MKTVYIYTDGSCLGNPGPGGYAAILKYGEHEKILAEGYQLTTNNRMEILAAIEALNALKLPCHVKLYSDSQYLRDGITKWMEKWKSNQWRTSNKKPVKNRDLWERLDQATDKHNIEWIWVKGHAGHPENEQCDLIAKQQAESPKQIDVEYEQDKELK